jgi:hypothetical protein
MGCPSCQSSNQSEYPVEMAIHFPGRENLCRSHLFIFPTVLICLDCGFSRFITPETDLRLARMTKARGEPERACKSER